MLTGTFLILMAVMTNTHQVLQFPNSPVRLQGAHQEQLLFGELQRRYCQIKIILKSGGEYIAVANPLDYTNSPRLHLSQIHNRISDLLYVTAKLQWLPTRCSLGPPRLAAATAHLVHILHCIIFLML